MTSLGSRLRSFAGIAAVCALVAVYLALCAAPFVIERIAGLGWGVLAGIALSGAWMRTMPTTCMSGGFLWSILGMQQFMLLCLWTVRGVALLVTTLV